MIMSRLIAFAPRATMIAMIASSARNTVASEAIISALTIFSSIICRRMPYHLFSMRYKMTCATRWKPPTTSSKISAASISAESYNGTDIISP